MLTTLCPACGAKTEVCFKEWNMHMTATQLKEELLKAARAEVER